MTDRRKGYVTPGRAARILGCHTETVRRWCRESVSGGNGRLSDVWQSGTGRYYVNKTEIQRIADRFKGF